MSAKTDNSPLLAGDFVHLHNHTQYSLLDGLTKVPELIDYVKQAGMDAVAITDHGTMSGVVEFYKTAKAEGIKPVIGIEAYIAPRSHHDRDPNKDKNYFHLTMLAMNQTGYLNLMRLSTLANLEGFYYKPRIDHELIEKYNEGIIVLSGCIGGEVADALRQNQYDKAKATASWYKQVFGDRYYIELQDHGHPDHPSSWIEQNRVNDQLLKLSTDLKIPAVVTCDAHYLKLEDQEAHEVLLCVQTGAYLSDENRMSLKQFHLNVADPKEVIKRWGNSHPELIRTSKKIAGRCNVELELGGILIPKFPLPKGETEQHFLTLQVWQGLAWRYGGVSRNDALKMGIEASRKKLSPEVITRAEFELKTINSMGFDSYMLIVADFINWGKDRGIVFGPGRGSAAGSIVAYALRITELDPIAYDLLFERFLNPDRIAMPDIDIDIQDSRRDEVIQYCIEKYGKEQVANIVTFGRMAARNAVRDVARVLQVPYAEADRIAKLIPPPIQGRHIPLRKSLETDNELKKEEATNQQAARVFELASRLEMTIRSHGVHAAGVVITPDEIVKYTPLELAQKGVIATQYSMFPIEELGLLKMDFLGLSNLTIIKNALRIIKKVEGKDIDITEIPLDDKKTFELLQRGETTGVFQLESAGMRRYLKQLKPTVFDDVIAMVALYRPGPMQWIEEFIARKNGERAINFLHPAMEPAVQNTYGLIVYQEQVMQISKEMCGFTGGQADTLRKAIGKKLPEVMAKLKSEFIEGAVNTVSAERPLMDQLWKQLEDFAAYCFNKSHAACYGLIAYQTAYLKAHYPAAFMAAVMTSDFDNTDRLAIEIAECKHMGMEVLPPDVNESFHEFAVVPGENQIRFGLDAIKNVGHGAAEEVIRARDSLEGSFESIEQFLTHVNCHIVNRKALESLVKSGALDRFKPRETLMDNLDVMIQFANRMQKEVASGQVDLFGNSTEALPEMAPQIYWENTGHEYSSREILTWERDLLGLYLSQHPLEAYTSFLEEQAMPLVELNAEMDNKTVVVAGSIMEKREINTKNGAKMAFVKIGDNGGEIELIIFPKVYAEVSSWLERDQVVLVSGKLNAKDRDGAVTTDIKVLVDTIREVTVDEAQNYKPQGQKQKIPKSKAKKPRVAAEDNALPERLYIRVEDNQNHDLLVALKQKLDSHQGETEVVLVTGPPSQKQIIRLPQRIAATDDCVTELHAIFGQPNIVLK